MVLLLVAVAGWQATTVVKHRNIIYSPTHWPGYRYDTLTQIRNDTVALPYDTTYSELLDGGVKKTVRHVTQKKVVHTIRTKEVKAEQEPWSADAEPFVKKFYAGQITTLLALLGSILFLVLFFRKTSSH